MKKLFLLCAAALLAPLCPLNAAEFHDKGEVIAVDVPAGWNQGKSDDPLVTLKLEKGKSVFEFSKQDSELSDYYLKARVKENVTNLAAKGAAFSGDVKPLSLHGVNNAYYAAYEMMGSQGCMAFLTYNGASYSVAARGIDEGDCRGVLSSVRKPGEKIELPKRPKVLRVKRVKVKEEPEEEPASYGSAEDTAFSTSAAAADLAASTSTEVSSSAAAGIDQPAGPSATQAMADSAGKAAQSIFDDLARKSMDKSSAPYYERVPLPFMVWGILLALWVIGAVSARRAGKAYQNPKLPHPPADVPPDFFFPFMITRSSFMKEVNYNVLTRQKQLLLGAYPYEHEIFLVFAVYGCLFFHIFWSFLAMIGRDGLLIGAMLKLPFGRFIASAPELFFLLPLFYGLYLYLTKKRSLCIYDAQSSLMMEAKKDNVYCLIRDGKGQEVARLQEKTGGSARRWDFIDTDNLVVFSIVDDAPNISKLRKFFGAQGGRLRAHYGIFVQDRRAGYVFLDPSSADRFQIHMDFDFARLANPAQILAAILYLTSYEKDTAYPSPF